MNHSDMNKLKYLNVLLLSEFKSKHILGENGLELNEHDLQQESENDQTCQDISTENEIPGLS